MRKNFNRKRKQRDLNSEETSKKLKVDKTTLIHDEEIPSDDEEVVGEEEINYSLDDNLFVDGEAENISEESEEEETLDEKRVRHAKEVIEKIKQVHGEELEKAETREEEEDLIAKKLRKEAESKKRKIPKNLSSIIKKQTFTQDSVIFYKGHKKPVTCIALTEDDKTVYTGGKDCCVIKWDVETGKKFIFKGSKTNINGHKTHITAIAVSSDGNFVATGGKDSVIKIWDTRANKFVDELKGHLGEITGLAFQMGTLNLFSSSTDRVVKVWDVNEMSYVDSLYGHEGPVMAVDSLYTDCALSCGNDNSTRYWKVFEESQLVYKGHSSSVDCVKLLQDDYWISGSQDGSIAYWSKVKRKPLMYFTNAHGGYWISSVGALRFSNIAASGSQDGYLKLWNCDGKERQISLINQIPITGFINGIAFSSTGKFVVAGVGQEHRLGRWHRIKQAKNGIGIIKLINE